MKLKSVEMGTYEDNGDVESLPGSPLHTPCTNSINMTEVKIKK